MSRNKTVIRHITQRTTTNITTGINLLTHLVCVDINLLTHLVGVDIHRGPRECDHTRSKLVLHVVDVRPQEGGGDRNDLRGDSLIFLNRFLEKKEEKDMKKG